MTTKNHVLLTTLEHVRNKKTVLVTHDGGRKWEPIKAACRAAGRGGSLGLLVGRVRQP